MAFPVTAANNHFPEHWIFARFLVLSPHLERYFSNVYVLDGSHLHPTAEHYLQTDSCAFSVVSTVITICSMYSLYIMMLTPSHFSKLMYY
jgi:hypothetical protein